MKKDIEYILNAVTGQSHKNKAQLQPLQQYPLKNVGSDEWVTSKGDTVYLSKINPNYLVNIINKCIRENWRMERLEQLINEAEKRGKATEAMKTALAVWKSEQAQKKKAQ